MSDEKNNQELLMRAFEELKRNSAFDIREFNDIPNIEDNPKFKKLHLTDNQKIQLGAFFSQIPALVDSSILSKTYMVSFPEGLPHTLMAYKTGGLGSPIMGETGIVGHAAFYSTSGLSVLSTAFMCMAIASQQYYLDKINKTMDRINVGVDKILEFLYGDKKAELMSEVSFAQYAYNNYSSIMLQDSQRIATIASLQEAKKIAMKDAEFYISDLSSTVSESSDIEAVVYKSIQIDKSLELALQLCVMSNIMEVYFSQNFDPEYLKYIDKDVSYYIDKCRKSVLSDFSKLYNRIENSKGTPLKKINKDELISIINSVLEPLQMGGESELERTLRDGLYSSDKQKQFFVSRSGEVYIKSD